jgi:hypothetical protein
MRVLAACFLISWPLSVQQPSQDTPWHLLDSQCWSEWSAVVRDSDILDVVGNCEGTETRVQRLAITNKAGLDAGRLQTFSLGFCGEILSAEAQVGWTASVVRKVASFGSPADVQWDVTDRVNGLEFGRRTTGFSVTLRPGGRRAIAYSATLENSGGRTGSPHGCGELPRGR